MAVIIQKKDLSMAGDGGRRRWQEVCPSIVWQLTKQIRVLGDERGERGFAFESNFDTLFGRNLTL